MSLRLNPTDITRFWAKVDKRGPDECWNWISAVSGRYGVLWLNGGNRAAHRISWVLHSGEIPDDLQVLHKCDNPLCVNPNHLFLGTNQDNVDDKVAKGRARGGSHWAGKTGEDAPNAKLTNAQCVEIEALYSSGAFNQLQLAIEYGVSRATIGRTIRNIRKQQEVNEP